MRRGGLLHEGPAVKEARAQAGGRGVGGEAGGGGGLPAFAGVPGGDLGLDLIDEGGLQLGKAGAGVARALVNPNEERVVVVECAALPAHSTTTTRSSPGLS